MKISEIKALNTVAEVERPISPHREDTSSSSEGSLVSSIVRNDAMRRGVGLRVSYFAPCPHAALRLRTARNDKIRELLNFSLLCFGRDAIRQLEIQAQDLNLLHEPYAFCKPRGRLN
jgi:hypothetical protein